MFFYWPITSFLVYGLYPMQFWTFKGNYFVSFVNRAFNVPRGTIEWNFFPTNNKNFSTSLDFEWKISWVPAGKLCHKCRNCSCVSRLRFPAVFLWKLCKFFLSFLYFDWFSFIFGWILLGRFCKTALYVPEDLFEEKQLVLEFFSILQPFPGLSGNFSGLWRKLCGSPVKSALFPPAEKTKEILFWKNVSISNIFLTSGWIVPDTQWHFSKVSSKSNFLFPKKNFGLNFVFKHKCLRLVLKPWANHIRTFDSKFLWTIFRTTSACPKQRLHEEHFLWKKCLFHNLLNLSGTSPGLW